jgi:hypothetical protein
MREGTKIVISSAVTSEVLEFHVLLLDSGSSVRAQSNIAVGDLSSRRVRAASEAEAASADL